MSLAHAWQVQLLARACRARGRRPGCSCAGPRSGYGLVALGLMGAAAASGQSQVPLTDFPSTRLTAKVADLSLATLARGPRAVASAALAAPGPAATNTREGRINGVAYITTA